MVSACHRTWLSLDGKGDFNSLEKNESGWPWWSLHAIGLDCLLMAKETLVVSKTMKVDDHHGHPLSVFSRLLKSHLPSRDNEVCWHVESIMVIHFFIVFKTIAISFAFERQASPLACRYNHGHPLSSFSRVLKSPLPFRENQVRWHLETIMVIRFRCFRDYCSLHCLLETSESIGMRRQSWSSVFSLFSRLL